MSASLRDLRASYRVLLRATSAAVSHQPAARLNLRKLYRPIFENAVIRLSGPQTTQRDAWMADFDERLNNTLRLLILSSLTPSPSQSYLQNSAFLTHLHASTNPLLFKNSSIEWDPHNPSSAKEQWAARKAKEEKGGDRKKMIDRFGKMGGFAALRETRAMAEGFGEIMLGRSPLPSSRWS